MTVLLAISSACVFVWDVGISFGRLIPVMSGIELLVSQSGPGVRRCFTLTVQTKLILLGPWAGWFGCDARQYRPVLINTDAELVDNWLRSLWTG